MAYSIVVDNLGKRFNRYHAQKPVTIMEAALSGLRRMRPLEAFWALRNVSFTVSPGEMVGILGHNGAGKSTLLQLIGGVGYPEEGRIQVNGRIGALLDLGAGFHPDLTGRENVFVNAVIGGLTHQQVRRRFDSIVEFAELASFIDNPLRTYSTGMQMRLAFSIAIHIDSEVLLVDEFLSVGDLSFQAKCLARIRDLKKQGSAIVLISHEPDTVKALCNKVIWLRHGQIVAQGDADVVAGHYAVEMHNDTGQNTPILPSGMSAADLEHQVDQHRFGSLEAEITVAKLLPSSEMLTGESLTIEINYMSSNTILNPVFSVDISRREDGFICLDTNTQAMRFEVEKIQGQGQVHLTLDRLDLSTGEYFVNVGIFRGDWKYAYDYHWHVYPLSVQAESNSEGLMMPPGRWRISSPMNALLSQP
ncbi:MAG: ABC transporter ATP-binding protein [Phormidesmis sp. RL_2_1]|nr:ABC transporter ATP-binding protein [Phormidesmis sp. RL_2_1]